MPEDAAHRIFRFGVFEADEAAGELRKHGIRIKLHSQPFQVLMLLVERPSVTVTREEMRQRLWDAETFVDFDHSLNTAVNKIREVLGDSASSPRFVATVAGKGYRFLAPVTLDTYTANEQVAVTTAEGGSKQSSTASVASGADPEGFIQAHESPGGMGLSKGTFLTAPDELPNASRTLVRTLLLLIQAMYLGFYIGALANLAEIHDIFVEASVPGNVALMSVLITSAAVLIPIRLFILVAVALDYQNLPSKFRVLFPVLLIFDLLWALSPFLLIHHINAGLALGLSAPLVYVPFAQRSLVLMYARGR